MSWPAFLFNILLAGTIFEIGVFRQNTKTEEWLEDFSLLKRELSDHYGISSGLLKSGKPDLKELSEQTELRLRQARDEPEANRTIVAFQMLLGTVT